MDEVADEERDSLVGDAATHHYMTSTSKLLLVLLYQWFTKHNKKYIPFSKDTFVRFVIFCAMTQIFDKFWNYGSKHSLKGKCIFLLFYFFSSKILIHYMQISEINYRVNLILGYRFWKFN